MFVHQKNGKYLVNQMVRVLGLPTYFVSYQLKENENVILNPNFIDDMNKLEFNKNTKIFFICSSGIRSQIVAEIFKKNNLKHLMLQMVLMDGY